MSNSQLQNKNPAKTQLTTFYVGADLFGVEVLKVQEVTGTPAIVPVPLAPDFVLGLVNLRGQIATALGLRQVFGKAVDAEKPAMSVVCKLEGNLMSLIVDSIGDVIEIENTMFEETPDTLALDLRRFIKGIYKMNTELLSVLDLDALAKELSPQADTSVGRAV